jgi:hypothetical protein
MNSKKMTAALIINGLALLLMVGVFASPAQSQNSSTTNTSAGGTTGTTAGGTTSTDGQNGADSNPGTAWDIRKNYMLRFPVAKEAGPSTAGGADVIQNKTSIGPGTVIHSKSGPVFIWPLVVPTAISQTPTRRDESIQKDLFQTFGLPVSDTQFQVIERYNQNRMLEQMFDPERFMWMANSTAGLQATSAANSAANATTNQAESAIDFTKKYLTNFTAQAGNRWQVIRDQLFIPMAILLLLPGAVLAQVRAIVAQGSPVFGDVNPFEGIIRSIVAIFLIPGTFLVINYGIDVANSITFTIGDEYRRIFGTDMYADAICAEQRAFASNTPGSNLNAVLPNNGQAQDNGNQSGTSVWNPYEAMTLVTRKYDPCAHVDTQVVPDESADWQKQITRMLTNGGNVALTGTWNIMCAFQMAFLYYLWCMGPIAAALWVWPIAKLRQALPSWIEGVIVLCFWALFWNTTVLLMACFRGVGDSGTVIMSALNCLSTACVQYAFDFSGLVSNGASAGFQQAMQSATNNAAQTAAGAGAGKAGAAGTGGAGGTGKGTAAGGGAGAGAGANSRLGALNSAMQRATAENQGSALMGGGGPGHALSSAAHVSPGGPLPNLGAALPPGHGSDPGIPGGVTQPPLSGHGAPGTIGGAGVPGAGDPSHPPLTSAGGGTSVHNAAAMAALHAGQDASHSSGLGLRMDKDGSLHMNQEALDKMKGQMGGQDPQKALHDALANHDMGALSNWENQARQAGVLDKQTESGINGMLHAGVVPTLGTNGQLSVGAPGALALANTGDMALTGVPTGANISTTGGLTDTASLSAKNDPNSQYNPINPSDASSQQQALQALATQEGQGNFSLVDPTTGQKVDPGQLGNLPAGEHLQAVNGQGQAFAQMDNNGQWHALDKNGGMTDITAGANGQWLAGGHVPVEGNTQGGFAAAGTNGSYAYDPSTGNFNVGGHEIAASAVSGQFLHEAYSGVPGATAALTALEQPGVAANLAAAANGDPSALAAVQQGLSGTGVNAETLYRASAMGDPLSSTQVMAQEAVANPGYAHQMAQQLGISDATLTSAASNPIAAAQVLSAETAYVSASNPGFTHDMAQHLGVSDAVLSSAASNPFAAAQVMGADVSSSGSAAYIHQTAQQLGVSDAVISSAAYNPIAATQMVAAEAGQNQAFARETAAALHGQVSADLMQSAVSNPIAAAQVLGVEARNDSGYAATIASGMGYTPDQIVAAGSNPLAAAQMVGHEAQASPQYASYVAQSLHMPSSELAQQMASNPVLAAQAVGVEAQMNRGYAESVGQAMHMSAETVMAAGNNPTMAAQIVGVEAAANPGYAAMVAQTVPNLDSRLVTEAASSPLAATQLAAAEAARNPSYGEQIAGPAMNIHSAQEFNYAAQSPIVAAQALSNEVSNNQAYASYVAHNMNLAPEVLQQAAYNPIAAAQVVAAESQANVSYGSYAAQALNMTDNSVMQYAAGNSVAAAQVLAADANANGVTAQLAQQLHLPTETVQQAAYSPVAAAQVVAAEAQQNQQYMSAVSYTSQQPADTISYAASNQYAAAQLMASEAARDPGYMTSVASALGVSPQVLQEARYNSEAASYVAAQSQAYAAEQIAAANYTAPAADPYQYSGPAENVYATNPNPTPYPSGGTVGVSATYVPPTTPSPYVPPQHHHQGGGLGLLGIPGLGARQHQPAQPPAPPVQPTHPQPGEQASSTSMPHGLQGFVNPNQYRRLSKAERNKLLAQHGLPPED